MCVISFLISLVERWRCISPFNDAVVGHVEVCVFSLRVNQKEYYKDSSL
jgi:hypothetical protein